LPKGYFPGGRNSGEISFYQLKEKQREKHFSTKKLIAKYQISKPRGLGPLPLPSDAHVPNNE